MNPIDLKTIAAGRYKIALDEAASIEPGGKKDSWYQVIPCRYGQIYPYSDNLLAVYVQGLAARNRLSGLAELTLCNWSDDGEAVFLFPLILLDLVAEVVKPRRKRRLSEGHKSALLDAGRAHLFRPRSTVPDAKKTGTNRPIAARAISRQG